MGYVGWIGTFQGAKGTGKENVYESEMTHELRASGAILYCKTAVPQSLMAGETINHIIKYCWNPKNRNLSCGGSSGGEGALVALKGSVVGIGTDIGGSIRLPGSYNGVYGLRPSSGRLPFWGAANSLDGLTTITSVTGPLSTSIGGLRLVVKSLLEQEPWLHDPLTLELPWRHELEQSVLDTVKPNFGKQLTFGVLWHDTVVRPSPPVTRALVIVSSTLKRLGHNVISWDPPSHPAGNTSAWAAFLFDRGHEIHANVALSNEPIVPQISALFGSSYAADTVQATASDIMAANIAKREYQKAYLDYWNSVNADAFISPVNSLPAPREGGYSYYEYSIIVNVLDLPAVVFPVTEVDKEVDRKGEFVPLDPEARDGQDERSWAEYEPELWDGAPVGLQVVGRRLQEEKVLALAGVIAEALRKQGV
jgi:amidase